jgi:hypothetical protein
MINNGAKVGKVFTNYSVDLIGALLLQQQRFERL